MIVTLDTVEDALAARQLSCGRGGRLAPWGFARARFIRQCTGPDVAVRPRRACCSTCERTTAILSDAGLSRRLDGTGVIGTALFPASKGQGHRSIAEKLDQPPARVRNSRRRARSRAAQHRACALRIVHSCDPTLALCAVQPTQLADTVEAMGSY